MLGLPLAERKLTQVPLGSHSGYRERALARILAYAAERDPNPHFDRQVLMHALELIAALIVALVVFVAIKLIGFVLYIALIGAVIGLVAGFVLARAFRKTI